MVNKKQLIRTLKATKDTIQTFSQSAANFSLIKSDMKHIIILTRPRSGSTCLLDLLSMHSNITTDPHNFYDYTKLPKRLGASDIRSKKYVCGYKFHIQPTSFDITPENRRLAEQGLEELTSRPSVAIIHLERENLVRQAVSWLLADHSKKQNYRKGQKPIKISSMTFEPELLLQRIQKFEALANFEKDVLAKIPHLYLSYERTLMSEKEHPSTMEKVFDFIGVEPEEVMARYMRLSSDDLSKSISNYDEIQNFLKTTHYFDQLTC